MKKPTNKYCSVRCCSIDPDRLERMRTRGSRGGRTAVVPLARQLSLEIFGLSDPEAEIDLVGEGREDVPRGMSRLVG